MRSLNFETLMHEFKIYALQIVFEVDYICSGRVVSEVLGPDIELGQVYEKIYLQSNDHHHFPNVNLT